MCENMSVNHTSGQNFSSGQDKTKTAKIIEIKDDDDEVEEIEGISTQFPGDPRRERDTEGKREVNEVNEEKEGCENTGRHQPTSEKNQRGRADARKG